MSAWISNPTVNGPTKLIIPSFTSVALITLSIVATLEPPTKKICVFHGLPAVVSAVICAGVRLLIESRVKSAMRVAVPPGLKLWDP